ncbi:hypothetical protein [uncultured Microscilla sp.]|uniref:tetratricopeptide repeat protein n=1 Tax=uncultured Microscilla sp. TaxID=432653 RepID=UPI002639747C|nr:hypothetical protein [uncultured Microscilla sp.]
MNLFNPKLTIALLFCIVKGAFCQSITPNGQKSFNFFYVKATSQLQVDINKAEINAFKADFEAKSKAQKYSSKYLLGNIFHFKKEYHKSCTLYEEALKYANKSQQISLKNNLAYSYFLVNKTRQALLFAKEVLHERVKSKHQYLYLVYGIIAKVHAKQGKLDSAKHYFSKAIKAIPASHKDKVVGGFLAAQADMYAQNGRPDLAENLYKKSLKHEKTPYKKAETFVKLAVAHAKTNRYHQAQQYIALAQNESSELNIKAQILKLESDMYYKQGNYAQLEQSYNNFKVLMNGRGNLLGADRSQYYAIDEQIYHQVEVLKNKLAHKEDTTTTMNWWWQLGLWSLTLSIAGTMALLAWHKTTEQATEVETTPDNLVLATPTKKDIKASDLKYSLKISHKATKVRTIGTKSDNEEVFAFLRNSRYRPPKT